MATQQFVTTGGKLITAKATRFFRMKQGTSRFMRELKEFKVANKEMNVVMASFRKEMSGFEQALNTQEVLDSTYGNSQCRFLNSEDLSITTKLQLDADTEGLRQSAIQLKEEKTGTVGRIDRFQQCLPSRLWPVYWIGGSPMAVIWLVNEFEPVSLTLKAISLAFLPVPALAFATIYKTYAAVRSWRGTWDDLITVADSSIFDIQEMFINLLNLKK